MSDSTLLGDTLRARREALKPQDVGLPEHGRRRVPGLRREVVAMLAGVSSDYYMRLEQGRETSPSPQMIDAIAAALRLDDEAHDTCADSPGGPRSAAAFPPVTTGSAASFSS
nr:helix-turn-helix transcriptional regulator [Streptomyces sp. TLI_185]